MEVLPFLTRPSRQVSCKPVISTIEELIWQKSNLARKKKTKKKFNKITFLVSFIVWSGDSKGQDCVDGGRNETKGSGETPVFSSNLD